MRRNGGNSPIGSSAGTSPIGSSAAGGTSIPASGALGASIEGCANGDSSCGFVCVVKVVVVASAPLAFVIHAGKFETPRCPESATLAVIATVVLSINCCCCCSCLVCKERTSTDSIGLDLIIFAPPGPRGRAPGMLPEHSRGIPGAFLEHSGAVPAPECSKNAPGMPRECSGSIPGASPRGPGGAKIIKSRSIEFVEVSSLQALHPPPHVNQKRINKK